MTIITKHRGSYTTTSEFNVERFKRYFNEIVQDTGQKHDQAKLDEIVQDIIDFVQTFDTVTSTKLNEYVLRYTNEAISKDHPDLKWVCASALRRQMYKDVSTLRGFDYKEGLGDFYTLLRIGVESGVLNDAFLDDYSKDDIDYIGSLINKEYDKNLDYAGLDLLREKYLPRNYNDEVLVLPQELFMLVSMYLMKEEDAEHRLQYIEDMYMSLGQLLLGLATPTLLNSWRPSGSLSSCHIVTVDDNLQNIMDTDKQIARFSQNGAGTAAYLGFLRGNGSWIRGYKGRASGVVHPSRLLNVIGEYVDQLG